MAPSLVQSGTYKGAQPKSYPFNSDAASLLRLLTAVTEENMLENFPNTGDICDAALAFLPKLLNHCVGSLAESQCLSFLYHIDMFNWLTTLHSGDLRQPMEHELSSKSNGKFGDFGHGETQWPCHVSKITKRFLGYDFPVNLSFLPSTNSLRILRVFQLIDDYSWNQSIQWLFQEFHWFYGWWEV